MYSQTYDIAQTPITPQLPNKAAESQSKAAGVVASNASNSSTSVVASITSERGYQKIQEVYSEYKSKGLISLDFPELTLVQLMIRYF
jgi:glutathione peroxidase-family protein